VTAAIVQTLVLLAVPGAALALAPKVRLVRAVGPIVLLFVVGVVAGNLPFVPIDRAVTEGAASVAVLLAIPLLLVPADVRAWLRVAPRAAGATALCFGSVAAVALATGLWAAPRFGPEGWKLAGMLAGTYTGGAANLVAIGAALGTAPDALVLVTTADVVVAGLFALVFLSPAVRLLDRWLPTLDEGPPAADDASPSPEGRPEPGPDADGGPAPAAFPRATPGGLAAAFGVALAAGAAGAGAALALPDQDQLAAILTVTTLGLTASFLRPLRAIRGCYQLGDYFLLVFCLAIGALADLSALAESSGAVVVWTTGVMLGGSAVHLALCRPLGVDRDTAVIALTAAIYGPAFVGPVATNLRSRQVVISGVTAGLVGLAVGNYLGLAVAWLVRLGAG